MMYSENSREVEILSIKQLTSAKISEQQLYSKIGQANKALSEQANAGYKLKDLKMFKGNNSKRQHKFISDMAKYYFYFLLCIHPLEFITYKSNGIWRTIGDYCC